MWLNGLILITVLAVAKSAEAEINVEAAFQGHCGHTSPCEQLCYEIHDGMYECDCIEGYELNKNGYSCQVINSTASPENPTKSEEDVLYQKGASFSAKLANGVNGSNQVITSDEDEIEEDEDFMMETDNSFDHLKSGSFIESNSKDYYISSDSISFNDDQLDLSPVPELQQFNSNSKSYYNLSESLTDSFASKLSQGIQWQRQKSRQILQSNDTSAKSITSGESTLNTIQTPSPSSNGMLEDDYYSKLDMSVYDDVNNNKLNLRPLDANTYQNEYNQLQAMSVLSATTSPVTMGSNSSVSEIKQINAANPEYNVSTPLRKIESNSTNYTREVCSLECGLDGVCEINEEGTQQCLCAFGKTGIGCLEDTKIRIPRFSRKSWLAFPALRGAYKHVQIRVEFRPESTDGIILLTGERDDLTGDFMALLMHQGFIEFWFDCGSGVGSVRSEETVKLKEWNSVTIYRHRWDAWLLLNHGSRVQGRSKGLFSRITFREPVFLGGIGNITGLAKRLPVYEGMIGCIRRFVANEHEYNFNEHPLGDVSKGFDIKDCTTDKCYKHQCQHEGKCLPSDQGAICLCPMGFVGDLCELRLDFQIPSFNGSSYLIYTPLGDSALIWLELQIIIKPLEENGIILYTGHEHHGDFIALSLKMGFVEFSFDLGSGHAVVRSEHRIEAGQWHTIKVSRTARLAVLKVNKLPEVMTISSNGFWHLSLPHNLYLGGVPHYDILPPNVRHLEFFTGCIQKVRINSRTMSIIGEALSGINVGNCPHKCNEQPCGPLSECVPLLDTYECRCGQFSQECNKMSNLLPQLPSSTGYKTDAGTSEASKPDLLVRNNQQKQHYQYIKPYSKHIQSHHSQLQSTQIASTNSLSKAKHDYKLKKKQKPSERKNTNKIFNDKARETPEVSFYKIDSKDFATADMYIDDTPIRYDFHLKHAHEPHMKETHFDENNLQSFITEYPQVLPFNVDGPKPHKHLRKKHQRLWSKKDFGEGSDNDQLEDSKHSSGIYKLDTGVFGNFPVMDKPRKRIHKRPSHRCKYHKKHTINYHEKRPVHKAPLSNDQTDEGIVIGDSLVVDVVDYHTKELFQDMKRIMKNSESSPSTIPTDILESKISGNYESEPESERIVRKSLGACFTGTDSYFHYNDAETMSQIISYKIDLNLRIKTHSRNGVILWSGRQTALGNDDYLSLGIENGYLHLRYNLGSGEANVQFNATKVSDGLWHRVRAIRNAQEGFLEVDGRKSVVQRSPGKLRQLNTDTGLYVGGMNDVSYFTRRRYSTGVVGCISEIILAGELKLNFDPATLGTAHNVETGIL